MLVGENDPGKRLLVGFTEGMPSEWMMINLKSTMVQDMSEGYLINLNLYLEALEENFCGVRMGNGRQILTVNLV